MTLRLILALLVAVAVPGRVLIAAEPEPRTFVKGSFDEIRHAHAGSPTIVHFWGLSCGPCLIELPDWGRLLRERRGLNLVVVHSDRLPRDMRMLTGTIELAGLAKAENWAFRENSMSSIRILFSEVDPEWRGEIPFTLLIAPDGTTERILGSVDMTGIRAWLDAQDKHKGGGNAHSNINVPGSSPSGAKAGRLTWRPPLEALQSSRPSSF